MYKRKLEYPEEVQADIRTYKVHTDSGSHQQSISLLSSTLKWTMWVTTGSTRLVMEGKRGERLCAAHHVTSTSVQPEQYFVISVLNVNIFTQ